MIINLKNHIYVGFDNGYDWIILIHKSLGFLTIKDINNGGQCPWSWKLGSTFEETKSGMKLVLDYNDLKYKLIFDKLEPIFESHFDEIIIMLTHDS